MTATLARFLGAAAAYAAVALAAVAAALLAAHALGALPDATAAALTDRWPALAISVTLAAALAAARRTCRS